jgi:predicted DNA-binding transcriptional regulator YafY
VNRTDRLYALVEELRAVSPRPRTAHQLAGRFEVSVRTVERDINALLQAGVPIYATPGPGGGYAIDKAHTLPPVNFTATEATALAIALSRPGASPLAEALRSAVRKVVAVLPVTEAEAARRLADRVHLLPDDSDSRPTMARVAEDAVVRSQVLEITYKDRIGESTTRQVEPLALVGSARTWYLVGHCRLRGGQRAFRLDRIVSAHLTGEPMPATTALDVEDLPPALRPLSILE